MEVADKITAPSTQGILMVQFHSSLGLLFDNRIDFFLAVGTVCCGLQYLSDTEMVKFCITAERLGPRG